ncbi:MAG: adenylate/guanylate cyclase domain-containing protein [Elusimicrobiales bacterium]
MTGTDSKKNKKNLAAGLMAFAFIPYWLGKLGETFAFMYLAAFEQLAAGKYKSSIAFGFGTLLLLGYIWARPAILYRRNPTPELKAKVRGRFENIYLHAAALLTVSALPSLLLFGLVKGWAADGVVPALALSLFVQLSVLPVIIDWIRARNGELMEQLYAREELYSLRPGFSMPLALKVGLLVAACALLPFGLAGAALWLGADPKAWSGPFTDLIFMCSVTLLLGLGVVFYGVQRPMNGLIERMRRLASGDYSRTRIYFADEIARLKAGFNEMAAGLKERDELHDTFGKYMSIEIARELIHKKKVDLGGEELEAAVMFCDIRNFTPISEKMGAAEVVAFLNEYFRYITPAIGLNNGVINKFLGDAVMAIYTPMMGSADYAADAVRSAAGMRRALAEFNASGRMPFKVDFGIGIHAGRLVAGNIGTFSRLEYTFIGDTVNVAARLQAKCKDFGTDTVISAAAAEKARGSLGGGFRFEPLGRTPLKGKTDQLEVFRLA